MAKVVITEPDYFMALKEYKKRRTIAVVQRTLGISYSRAKKLINEGPSDLDLPSFKQAIKEDLEEKKEQEKKARSLIDPDQDLKKNAYIYLGIQKSAVDYYNPNSDGGEPMTVKGLKEMIELGDVLRKKERRTYNELLLPYEDMTDKEFNDLATGKKKPKR